MRPRKELNSNRSNVQVAFKLPLSTVLKLRNHIQLKICTAKQMVFRSNIQKSLMGRKSGTHGEKGSEWRVLKAKPGGKRQLERLSSRWENNFMKVLQEMKECGLEFSGSRLGQRAGTCEHGNEHSGFHKFSKMSWKYFKKYQLLNIKRATQSQRRTFTQFPPATTNSVVRWKINISFFFALGVVTQLYNINQRKTPF